MGAGANTEPGRFTSQLFCMTTVAGSGKPAQPTTAAKDSQQPVVFGWPWWQLRETRVAGAGYLDSCPRED